MHACLHLRSLRPPALCTWSSELHISVGPLQLVSAVQDGCQIAGAAGQHQHRQTGTGAEGKLEEKCQMGELIVDVSVHYCCYELRCCRSPPSLFMPGCTAPPASCPCACAQEAGASTPSASQPQEPLLLGAAEHEGAHLPALLLQLRQENLGHKRGIWHCGNKRGQAAVFLQDSKSAARTRA